VHEVLRVIDERTRSGSRPGHRNDGLRVVLSVEGGGMRGTVSAGMALALHELGLTNAFDAVYGASAGAITGAWLLSSEPEKLRGWTRPDYARRLIRWSAALRRQPVVNVRWLIEVGYTEEFPMDFESVIANPIEYHPLATDAATGESTDLRPLIADPAELRLALRASASLPFLAGPPVTLRQRRFYDAGVAESIPFRTPMAQGATHILVLRSRRPPALAAASATQAATATATATEAATEAEAAAERAAATPGGAPASARNVGRADRVGRSDDADDAEVAVITADAIATASPASGPGAPAPPPRSVRFVSRTTLRKESPELRAALLSRSARSAADIARIAELDAAGQALMVYPPESVPPVSRLTTDAVLLAGAFESGREAVRALDGIRGAR
jgi:predicted patatin/cPLA2 family phospholipase